MSFMDVFEGNPFSLRSLTATVNEERYVPGQLSSLGIFSEEGETSTLISVEASEDSIALVPTSPRGGPGTKNKDDGRKLIPLVIPHLELEDEIMADEVQGVRAFGTENTTQTILGKVNSKNRRMSRNLDATMEYHRLGALKGTVLDADGSTVLFDYATIFGESIPTPINFDLDNASPGSGALRQKCSDAIRIIQEALDGLTYTSIHALCGPTFFDQLQAHPEYREVHLTGPSDAQVLRQGVPYRQVTFGGITFEEYRGPTAASGISNVFIGAGDCHFIPLGVEDLFETRFAPADYFDTVNTVGLPKYARTRPDANAPDRRRILEVQTNPINICTRPRLLLKATNT